MNTREIVHIDEKLCDGCGKCILSCAEGALQLIDGKARLVGEIYCDGLGACLGSCPRDAITILKREAEEFDAEATEQHLAELKSRLPQRTPISTASCPGLSERRINVQPRSGESTARETSALGHWPVQLGLLSPGAACFQDSELVLTADCVPVAVPDFHDRFLEGRSIALACPKLDNIDPHLERLTAIIAAGTIRKIKVLRMEVPCCSGLTRLAQTAIASSGKNLPMEEIILGIDGQTREPDIELTIAG